jgi:flavin reductase (DIM6/NTAB) family NADH-FMN oxidoreductase RutF
MKRYTKKSFPVDRVRKFLEPGPIVLLSSTYQGKDNIMTLGWHMMMEYDLIGCYLWDIDYSRELISKSKECCINVPEIHLLDQTVGIGNTTGAEIDKFESFGLTAEPAKMIKAPLIKECYANIECKVIDMTMAKKYSLFILQVVAARAALSPKYPKTFHYTGEGVFMISGEHISRRKLFKPDRL